MFCSFLYMCTQMYALMQTYQTIPFFGRCFTPSFSSKQASSLFSASINMTAHVDWCRDIRTHKYFHQPGTTLSVSMFPTDYSISINVSHWLPYQYQCFPLTTLSVSMFPTDYPTSINIFINHWLPYYEGGNGDTSSMGSDKEATIVPDIRPIPRERS